jgi:hypothetical protein
MKENPCSLKMREDPILPEAKGRGSLTLCDELNSKSLQGIGEIAIPCTLLGF